jgi:hypothetical protein
MALACAMTRPEERIELHMKDAYLRKVFTELYPADTAQPALLEMIEA